MTKFYSKMPRDKFMNPQAGFSRSIEAEKKSIEECYRPGYTSEPYIQLVCLDDEVHSVLAEYMPGKGWSGSLEAAGLISHSCR